MVINVHYLFTFEGYGIHFNEGTEMYFEIKIQRDHWQFALWKERSKECTITWFECLVKLQNAKAHWMLYTVSQLLQNLHIMWNEWMHCTNMPYVTAILVSDVCLIL